eukprot:COSAG05_NODE_3171_length_2268_cov_2.619640_4_plen_89_part_00
MCYCTAVWLDSVTRPRGNQLKTSELVLIHTQGLWRGTRHAPQRNALLCLLDGAPPYLVVEVDVAEVVEVAEVAEVADVAEVAEATLTT